MVIVERYWRVIFTLGCLLMLILTPAESQKSPVGSTNQTEYSIIPKPVKVEMSEGKFILSSATEAIVSDEHIKNARVLIGILQRATGIKIKLNVKKSKPQGNGIQFVISDDRELGDEGYKLSISPREIAIRAGKPGGWVNAVQTLIQLLPPESYARRKNNDFRNQWSFPCAEITDTPRFKWRGMHLDVSRHFFPEKYIYTYIDMLAMHKFNTFHWHLTDDQGWRLEIKKYPLLTKIGAWRVDREDRNWDSREPQAKGEEPTYGGFYTQEEIKKIVKYASYRNITIVPEIEMPAHTTAALAAYPQFSCTGGPFTVQPGGVWPITDLYCAGNDSTFYFLQDILTEVMTLFPGQYIHVGGDEADKKEWKRCGRCQARMKQEGLADESELQSYFIKRIEKFISSKGRRLIGWDEILEGGLPSEATVMSWRGESGGITAAKLGKDVVMTPGSYCYFDYYQGKHDMEPLAGGGYTPLRKVYSFEPVPESLREEEAIHILGAQANVWTEYIPGFKHVQYMILPRMAAMAEVLWSPKKEREWNDFSKRLGIQFQRYDGLKYNYSTSAYAVSILTSADFTSKEVLVSMETELPAPEIRYTLDGTDPNGTSQMYETPFAITSTSHIKATVFPVRKIPVTLSEWIVNFHKAIFAGVRLTTAFEKYGTQTTLTDGLRGSMWFNDGEWQGYHQNDFEVVIDLGSEVLVERISAGFLQNTVSWIFFPTYVEYSVGKDTSSFIVIGKESIPVAGKNEAVSIKNIVKESINMTARYIRVIAKNVGVCPEWHPGRGDKAWLFIDEIVVE